MVKVTMMGEDVSLDDVSGDDQPVELGDHFKPVRLSPDAINQASQIVPSEFWITDGLYVWLKRRAEHVFKHLPGSAREGRMGKMKYVFEFDHEGPVLKRVFLG